MNVFARVARNDRIANRLHQVRLAQTDTAIDKQRIVRAARMLTDRIRGRVRHLI